MELALAADAQIPPEIQPAAGREQPTAGPLVAHCAADRGAAARIAQWHPRPAIRWPHDSKLPQYLWGMTWEWILVGFVWLGIRKRIRLRDLIGGRWATARKISCSMWSYAAAFWVCALVVLGHGRQADAPRSGRQDRRHAQAARIPDPGNEARTGRLVLPERDCRLLRGDHLSRISATAVRRHHATPMLAGVLLSALVFGASHGYEGVARMILIGIYGLMFGVLAWWRKSLRPGMIAHAWHDALSGAVSADAEVSCISGGTASVLP